MKKQITITNYLSICPKCCAACKTARATTRPATPKQILQRNKFKTAGSFAAKFTNAIKIGRKDNSNKLPEQALFVKELLSKAIVDSGDDFVVDYSKIVFSKNRSLSFELPEISLEPISYHLLFQWTGFLQQTSSPDVHLLIYNETLDRGIHLTSSMQNGNVPTVAIEIPHFCNSDILHYWYFLVADKGRSISKSYYIDSNMLLS